MSANLTCESVARAILGEAAKKKGAELLYLCPRHDDHHESFLVNPSKGDQGAWLCGPCGASGKGGWSLGAFVLNLDPNDKTAVTAALRERGLLNGNNGSGKRIAPSSSKPEPAQNEENFVRVAEFYYGPDLRKVRLERPNPDGGKLEKTFRWEHLKDGKWVSGDGGLPKPLYVNQVFRDRDQLGLVLGFEGEAKADAAGKLGLAAFSFKGFTAEHCEVLADGDVVLFPDKDEPGDKQSKDAATILAESQQVRSIGIVTPPSELPIAGDLIDGIRDHGWDADRIRDLIAEAKAFEPRQAPEPDEAAEKAIEEARQGQETNGVGDKPKAPPKAGLNLVPVGEMLKEPEVKVQWVLEDILPAGGLAIIVAKPKVGKSTWVRCLAKAVSRGEYFLGRATERGPVIYLALEEKRSEVIAHFRAMGTGENDPIFVHCAHAPDGALFELRLLVEKHKPVLIIIDPLLKLVRVKDANAYAEMCSALEPLLILARETGALVVLTHHSGKAERSEAMDSILGSTAIFGGVDTAIVMRRTDRYRTMCSVQRYGTDLPETVLEFDPDERMLTLGAVKSEAELGRIGTVILEYLEGKDEPLTETEILSGVEGRQAMKRPALRELHAAGKISRAGTGKRGDPYRYHTSQVREPDAVRAGTSNPEKPESGTQKKSSDSRTLYVPGTGVRPIENYSYQFENKQEKLVPDVRAGNEPSGYEKRDSSVQGTLEPEDLDFLEF